MNVKYTSEQVAEAVGSVLRALERPLSGQLVSAEETGLDNEMLLDLYTTGHLWIARRGHNEVVFGVTPFGRQAVEDAALLAKTAGGTDANDA